MQQYGREQWADFVVGDEFLENSKNVPHNVQEFVVSTKTVDKAVITVNHLWYVWRRAIIHTHIDAPQN